MFFMGLRENASQLKLSVMDGSGVMTGECEVFSFCLKKWSYRKVKIIGSVKAACAAYAGKE